MDLQLHDGYVAAPRRVFTNTRQLLRSAYGTPTYFQFLNESGMDESYDDETLEAGFGDFLQNFQQFKGQVQGKTPTPVIGKQELITAGKTAAGQVLQNITQPSADPVGGAVQSIIQTGASLIPGGGLVMAGVDALGKIFGGGGQETPVTNVQQARAVIAALKNMAANQRSKNLITMAKLTEGMIAKKEAQFRSQFPDYDSPQQPAPVVAALPTGFPMVGKTAAGLAPEAGLPPAPKTGTFAGMDLKTLALLGIGGFLAYKFLTKK